MRRTDNPAAEESGAGRGTAPVLFGRDTPESLAALRRVTGAAMLAGIALSPRLWLPLGSSFPRLPLFEVLPSGFVPAAEYTLGGLLIVTLAALVLAKEARWLLTAAVVVPALLLVLLDQTRLQPWVYQYLLLLIVAAPRGRTSRDARANADMLSAPRLIVASLYFWGGAQKLNHAFLHEVVPQLYAPLQGWLPLAQGGLSALGFGAALCEVFIGFGLLLGRTRKLCAWLALAMHAFILGLLVAQGRNSVVWAWNVALMLLVPILFLRGGGTVPRAFTRRRAADSINHAMRALALGAAVLPLLSFWGLWEMNLSGALYAGNKAVAVVRVARPVFERLPAAARRHVFETSGGELMLPVFEWAMADLNVPPYPEPRAYRQVAREVCRLAEDGGQVELIVKGRPAILDGSFNVSRMSCTELGD